MTLRGGKHVEKYRVTITEIGEMAEELILQGMMVLFDNTAPPELREISVMHTGEFLNLIYKLEMSY